MAATSTDVVNEALNLIGYDGFPVTGVAPNFDGSTPGKIAAQIYAPAVAAVSRINTWSFPRTVVQLSQTGNAAPFPWSFEYAFPASCIDVWQLSPISLPDLNNPVPYSMARGVAQVSSVQSSVIWANLAGAFAVFNSNPLEQTWDPLFRASVVSYLASEFGLAGLGKPDLAELYMDRWKQIVPLASERTDQ